jgi:hypothetical protein
MQKTRLDKIGLQTIPHTLSEMNAKWGKTWMVCRTWQTSSWHTCSGWISLEWSRQPRSTQAAIGGHGRIQIPPNPWGLQPGRKLFLHRTPCSHHWGSSRGAGSPTQEMCVYNPDTMMATSSITLACNKLPDSSLRTFIHRGSCLRLKNDLYRCQLENKDPSEIRKHRVRKDGISAPAMKRLLSHMGPASF